MPHRPTHAAGKAAGAAKAAKAALFGQKGIFKRLQREHGEVSMLMNRVAVSSDAKVRRDLFPKIKQELLSHAKAEEKEFYSVLKRFEETKGMVAHSLEEHNEVEYLLGKLSRMDIAGEAWGDLFDDLVQRVHEHVREEEHELFPKAKKCLSGNEVEEMEHRFIRQKEAEKEAALGTIH